MTILLLYSFIAGIVTILSPCILPVLPILLSSTADRSGRRRPFGIITGFIFSFTFFTLFLSVIVRGSGISVETLRNFSLLLLIGFGLSILVPQIKVYVEKAFIKISSSAPKLKQQEGFIGGLLIGFSVGLLWSPCVGPILASVISLALAEEVTFKAILITLAYSAGTAIPMFIIVQGGSTVIQSSKWLAKHTHQIEKIFAIMMILTAIALFFDFDKKFQSYVVRKFPNYVNNLTQFERSEDVIEQL